MKSLVVWTATLVWLVATAPMGHTRSAGCPASLPAGTIIRIFSDEKLTAGITSGPIIFSVGSDVQFFPNRPPLLSRGSKILGQVVESKQAGRLWGKSRSHIVLTSILTADSCEYPIEAKIVEAGPFKVEDNVVWGRGHAKRDVFALLFPPTTVYQLLRIPSRGPKLILNVETPLVMKLLQPVSLGQTPTSSSENELSSLHTKLDQLERQILNLNATVGPKTSMSPTQTTRLIPDPCSAADLHSPTRPIVYKDGVLRPVRNMTPYHVRLYLNRTPLVVLPPCSGPSMVRTPTSEFELEGTASLLTAGGQTQIEVKIVPNVNENGWDVVWSRDVSAAIGTTR
jgi:hypothetical protein